MEIFYQANIKSGHKTLDKFMEGIFLLLYVVVHNEYLCP